LNSQLVFWTQFVTVYTELQSQNMDLKCSTSVIRNNGPMC